MVSLRNKRSNKESVIKCILEKYKKDLDANNDSIKLLEKELSTKIEENPDIKLIPENEIDSFKRKYPNEV